MKRLSLRTLSAAVCGITARPTLVTPAHADASNSSDPAAAGTSGLEPDCSSTPPARQNYDNRGFIGFPGLNHRKVDHSAIC